MKNYPKYLRASLRSVICDMAKHPEDFCRAPGKDFTRKRKLPFDKLLTLLVNMGGYSLRDEMKDFFGFQKSTASVSALVQQRSKIRPEALEYLFHEFTDTCERPKLYKGYRLLAVDGSDIQFTADPNEPLCYFPGANGQRPYSLLHLNALYDLGSHLYLDAVVQKRKAEHENAALIEMVERYAPNEPAIVIADRNYESYNILATLASKEWKYLIRLRETKGIIAAFPLPAGDFDLPVQMILSRKKNKAFQALQKNIRGSTNTSQATSTFRFSLTTARNFIRSLFGSSVSRYPRIPLKRSLPIWDPIFFPRMS